MSNLPEKIEEAIDIAIGEATKNMSGSFVGQVQSILRDKILIHLGPYLSIPKEEQEDTMEDDLQDQIKEHYEGAKIEKIERQLCELSVTGGHTKITHDTESTINKLIEAVNYLLNKQK